MKKLKRIFVIIQLISLILLGVLVICGYVSSLFDASFLNEKLLEIGIKDGLKFYAISSLSVIGVLCLSTWIVNKEK